VEAEVTGFGGCGDDQLGKKRREVGCKPSTFSCTKADREVKR